MERDNRDSDQGAGVPTNAERVQSPPRAESAWGAEKIPVANPPKSPATSTGTPSESAKPAAPKAPKTLRIVCVIALILSLAGIISTIAVAKLGDGGGGADPDAGVMPLDEGQENEGSGIENAVLEVPELPAGEIGGEVGIPEGDATDQPSVMSGNDAGENHADQSGATPASDTNKPAGGVGNATEQSDEPADGAGLPDDAGAFAPSDGARDGSEAPDAFNAENEQGVHAVPSERRGVTLATGYVVALTVFSLLFSLSLCILLASWRLPRFYREFCPVLCVVLGTILLTLLLAVGTVLLTEQLLTSSEPATLSSAETAAESGETALDAGVIVEDTQIDLSAYDTNIIIARAGTYTLSGSFAHSVIVDAEGAEVELILNGVTISAPEAAAIAGLSAERLTISLADGTESILTDAGNSEYDGCVFSYAELVFTGNGTLTVSGEQEEGEGIATKNAGITFEGGTYLITSADDGINTGGDGGMITINGGEFYINAGGDGIDSNSGAEINGGTVFVIGSDTGGDSGIDTETGYTINGGTVVALGSDMLEKPASTSAQPFMALSLSEAVATGEAVGLTDANSLALIAFSAPKSFRTVIISTAELSASGQYQLKTGGSFRGGAAESNGFTVAGANSYSGGTAVTVGGESFFGPE